MSSTREAKNRKSQEKPSLGPRKGPREMSKETTEQETTTNTTQQSDDPLAPFRQALPQYPRFLISGAIGTVLFERFNNSLFDAVPWQSENKSALIFGLSYFISCIWQHFLHRHLVFGSGGSEYFASLVGFYGCYGFSIVASVAVNWILTVVVGLGHAYAYWGTLALVGVINYFTAGAVMGGDGGGKEKGQ